MIAFAKKDAGKGEHIGIFVGVQTAIASVKINVAFPPKVEVDLPLYHSCIYSQRTLYLTTEKLNHLCSLPYT